jgi:uncharacterized membrane protein
MAQPTLFPDLPPGQPRPTLQRILSLVFRSFLKGLIILMPIAITAYVLFFVFTKVDRLIPWVPIGLGFVIVTAFVTIVGFLGTRWFLGKLIFDFFDHLLERTPGIKYIYSSVKDVIDSFVGDKRKFNQPVWVRVQNDPVQWRIGFLTREDLSNLGRHNLVAVYLPHSYAISGWVVLVEADTVEHVTGMSAAEAMKFAVSGGITSPADVVVSDTGAPIFSASTTDSIDLPTR